MEESAVTDTDTGTADIMLTHTHIHTYTHINTFTHLYTGTKDDRMSRISENRGTRSSFSPIVTGNKVYMRR
jgi:hypothetical protein